MAGTLASAYVAVKPDTRGFGPALSRDLSRTNVTGAGMAVGRTFASGIKRMAVFSLATLGVASAIDFAKQSIQQGREAAQADRLVGQAIRATGREAQFSVASIDKRAAALMAQVGVDDEVIKSGMTLMLSFKNVRNQVGQGADVFDRANKMALDMAQALGLGIPQATRVLGKALNDPLKGMTAMGRVGITFSKQQQTMIKGWVAHGQTLRAQEFILGQLEGRFKGMAKAAADPATRARVAWGEFEEWIGKALLPMVNAVASWFADTALPAVMAFGDAVGKMFNWLGDLINYVKALFSGTNVGGFADSVQNAGNIIYATLGRIRSFVGEILTAVMPVIDAFVSGMTTRLAQFAPQIRAAFTTVLQIVKAVWDLIVVVVRTAMTVIQDAIKAGVAIIQWVWRHWGQDIMAFLTAVFGALVKIVAGALNAIKGIIRFFVAVFKGDWSGAWAAIRTIFAGAWDVIKGIVNLGLTVIRTAIDVAWAAVKQTFKVAWEGIAKFFSTIWRGIKNVALTGVQGVVGAMLWLAEKVVSLALKAFGWVPIVGDKLRSAQKAVSNFRSNFNKEMDRLKGKSVNVTTTANFNWSAARVLNAANSASRRAAQDLNSRAAGGPIRGLGLRRRDTVPVLAAHGEYMLSAADVDKMGGFAGVDAFRGALHRAIGGSIRYRTRGMAGVHAKVGAYDSAVGQVSLAMAKGMQEQMIRMLGVGAGGGGAGVQRWAPMVLQVLRSLGQSAAWLGTVLRRMNQESGGNQFAVNRWDSNWLAGHPSVGLMQVIRGTFARYANGFRNVGPFLYGVSTNAFANTFAGLNYAVHRYGSLGALARAGGYDTGGMLPPGAVGINLSKRPERVLSGAQTEMFERLLARGAGNVFQITVNPTPLAHPADIGREVVHAIQSYERANGGGWRK